MREILFRGKRIDNEEWVFGNFVVDALEQKNGLCGVDGFIRYYDFAESKVQMVEVDRPTVGQYTGLCDKNGKKLFEGDIVEYNTFDDFDCYSTVNFGKYRQDGSGGEYLGHECVGWFVAVDNFTCPDWAEDDPAFFSEYLMHQNLYEVAADSEILGNIHDNPELLGG